MKTYQNTTPSELREMTDGKTLAQLQKELEFQQSMGETLGGNICGHIVYCMEMLMLKSKRPVMKTELTAAEIKQLEKRIIKHFQNSPRIDRHGKTTYRVNGSDYNGYLGLAYTSSSDWTGLWVCNEEVYFDIEQTYAYIGFGMDMGGFSVALCHDEDENELYVFI